MKDVFIKAGVERQGIFDLEKLTKGAEKSYKTITSSSNAASDHGAVWADFNL